MEQKKGLKKKAAVGYLPYGMEQIVPFRRESLLKSNYFIGTKYKASNMENQITYMAMMSIQNNDFDEQADGIYVTLKANEIKKFTGYKGGSFYDKLKLTADAMTGNNMGIVDDELQEFDFITLINRAKYKDGVFMIRFANELRDKLISVKKNFTILPKEIVRKMRRPYSFPLYQLLKSQCYYPTGYKGERKNYFGFSIGLSELKLDMGVVNSNETEVKAVLNRGWGTTADYDKAVSKAAEQMFRSWGEFERGCLRPTVEEINEVSDIYVAYEKILGGHGGKVLAVDFRVWLDGAEKTMGNVLNVPVKPDVSGEDMEAHLSDEQKFTIALDAGSKLQESGFAFQYGDVVAICEAANYDMDIIKDAIGVAKAYNQRKPLTNAPGLMIAAIKNKWSSQSYDAVEGKGESQAAKKNSFTDVHEREYDFDELESILLSTQPQGMQEND